MNIPYTLFSHIFLKDTQELLVWLLYLTPFDFSDTDHIYAANGNPDELSQKNRLVIENLVEVCYNPQELNTTLQQEVRNLKKTTTSLKAVLQRETWKYSKVVEKTQAFIPNIDVLERWEKPRLLHGV